MTRLARLLNAQLEHWREGLVPDGMGGQTRTWGPIGSVRCRVSQPGATERVVAEANGADLSHVVFLLPTSDVRRGDQLRDSGRIFEVKATYEPSVPGTYLRADCRVRQASTP